MLWGDEANQTSWVGRAARWGLLSDFEELAFMATVMRESCVSEIGETAGKVWHVLDVKGPQTVAKLVKELDDIPRDVIMQGLGWLAREDKLEIEEEGRTKTVSLKAN